MQKITSKDNEFIKHIRKLKDKKYRNESNEFIIEGVNLIEEAIKENAKIKHIVICEECEKTNMIPKSLMYEISKFDCIYVSESVLKSITQVVAPQGIFAIIDKESSHFGTDSKRDNAKIDFKEDIIVALDDVQDPGNLGTILRTIDSCGLRQVLLSKGSVDSYNPKVVRSTMGAIFRVNVIECENLVSAIKEAKKHHFKVMVSVLDGDKTIYDINYNKKLIVIGNEANGVSKAIQDMADEKVKIPMLGKAESLNASVATGVILYEYSRQKIKGE